MSTSEGHSCVGGKVREARLRLRTERPKRKFTDVAKGEEERKGGVRKGGKDGRSCLCAGRFIWADLMSLQQK